MKPEAVGSLAARHKTAPREVKSVRDNKITENNSQCMLTPKDREQIFEANLHFDILRVCRT